MVYRVIGLMSGSSLDGLDIAFVEFHEHAGKWSYKIVEAECYLYTDEWIGAFKKCHIVISFGLPITTFRVWPLHR